MQKDALNNVHITDEQVLMTPEQLKAAFPLSLSQEAQIAQSRKTISDIIMRSRSASAGGVRPLFYPRS